jgi:membrane protease YdiL (CAAX protease family)
MRAPTTGVALYGALAYAITWVAVSPLVAQALGLREGGVPAGWHVVGALGPVGAAFLTAWITEKRNGLRTLVARVTRYRIPIGWWAIAAGSPLALAALAVIVARVVQGEWPTVPLFTGPAMRRSWWVGLLAVSVAYGLGEEPGWRGFLLPRLMRRRSARAATLWVAVIWSAWHIPFFAYRYDFAGLPTVLGFFTAMFAGACWLTFLYLSTDRSVPAVATWHVLWNVVNLVGAEMSDLVVGVLNVTIIVLGFGVLLTTGPGMRWPPAGRSRAGPFPHTRPI